MYKRVKRMTSWALLLLLCHLAPVTCSLLPAQSYPISPNFQNLRVLGNLNANSEPLSHYDTLMNTVYFHFSKNIFASLNSQALPPAGISIGPLTTISFAHGSPSQIHRVSGSFLAAGLRDNITVEVAGSTHGFNGTYNVATVTATDLTLTTSYGWTGDQAAGDPITLTTTFQIGGSLTISAISDNSGAGGTALYGVYEATGTKITLTGTGCTAGACTTISFAAGIVGPPMIPGGLHR